MLFLYVLICEQSVQSVNGTKSPGSIEGKARYIDKEHSCTELFLIMGFLHLLSNSVLFTLV